MAAVESQGKELMRYSSDNPDQIFLNEKGLVFGLFHDLRNDPGTIIGFNYQKLLIIE